MTVVILLTSDTPHHLLYAWKIREDLDAIVLETRKPVFPYETHAPLDSQMAAYERSLLKGGPQVFEDLDVRMLRFHDVNDAAPQIREMNSELAISFGTGRIGPELRSIPKYCLNLHGGNPEAYRGLDSHLWAIWHEDLENLETTLHYVNGDWDDGDIVCRTKLKPFIDDPHLFALRAANVDACVRLTLWAVDYGKQYACTAQSQRGRYYSAMPAVLKDVCVRKFEKWANQ